MAVHLPGHALWHALARRSSSRLKTLMHGANCAGFILGVVESHPNLCIPEAVTQTQMLKVVYAYSDRNPKYLNLLAEYIVYYAIADGFGTSVKGTVCK
jgi:hypothetical protein